MCKSAKPCKTWGFASPKTLKKRWNYVIKWNLIKINEKSAYNFDGKTCVILTVFIFQKTNVEKTLEICMNQRATSGPPAGHQRTTSGPPADHQRATKIVDNGHDHLKLQSIIGDVKSGNIVPPAGHQRSTSGHGIWELLSDSRCARSWEFENPNDKSFGQNRWKGETLSFQTVFPKWFIIRVFKFPVASTPRVR